MAKLPIPKQQQHASQSKYSVKSGIKFVKSLIFDVDQLPLVTVLILFAELFINIVIIEKVKYTEIDWKAYMQECEGFLNGTTDYSLLKGDTGPLVYPAGFVYIYSALYYITSQGQNIRLAQYIFMGVYLLQLYLVLRLYSKSRKLPPFVVVICTFTSYRIHSIYVLRLFNDPIAILFLYAAINLFLDQRWTLGSICLSLGVSVKMNVLLFAPAILVLFIASLGYVKTIIQLAICGVIQLILGAPFLLTHPVEYLKGSFDFGRVFEHKWTVNYRFLDRTTFESKYFHFFLLSIQMVLLGVLTRPTYNFLKNYSNLRSLQKQLEPQIAKENEKIKRKRKEGENEAFKSIHFDQAVQLALLPIFLCNLIGIACSRSLHYQFYVWYYHSLPYLTFCTDFSIGIKFLILGLIELCWNTYPSTEFSSLILHGCHILLLFKTVKFMFVTKDQSSKIKLK
ncbi:ALG3 family protein [Megaselia abdita]